MESPQHEEYLAHTDLKQYLAVGLMCLGPGNDGQIAGRGGHEMKARWRRRV